MLFLYMVGTVTISKKDYENFLKSNQKNRWIKKCKTEFDDNKKESKKKF